MTVDAEGRNVPITQLPIEAAQLTRFADDPDKAEHLVRVNWLKTVPLAEAIKEKGFFGNQNSVARPKDPKWDYTVQRLKKHFGVA